MSSLVEACLSLGYGDITQFWEDVWISNTPLSPEYPLLYNIVQHKDATVANGLSNRLLNVSGNFDEY
jgi:hypothetical protein